MRSRVSRHSRTRSGARTGTADANWGTAAATAVPPAIVASLAADRAAIYNCFRDLRAAMPRDVITTHDAATINSWSGYFWPTYVPEGNIWPWGSAALGFGLPIAIGAAVAAPDQPVIAFMGDGGFGFTAMELATAVRYGLNVNVIIHNDNAFSSIGNYQKREFGRVYETELTNPDFVPFARSFGAAAKRVDRWEDAAAAAIELIATPGPTLLEIAAPIKAPFPMRPTRDRGHSRGAVVLWVELLVKPEYRQECLDAIWEDANGALDQEPGCLRFDVTVDTTNPNRFMLFEVYRDADARTIHRAAPYLRRVGGRPRHVARRAVRTDRGGVRRAAEG